tara:strand:+ start:231 stop:1679 length:1449 start_codon:yes stop_codon:yes gene_type:complete
MNFNILRDNKFSKSEVLLYILTIIFLLLLAFENFYRYPIIQQLALADNFEKYNQLYPNLSSENPGFTSDYFPGIAFFIYFLKIFISDNFIIEAILISPVAFIIFFFYLNKKIISEIYPNNIDFKNYWLICIIFTFWTTRMWLWYALELKSDFISFSLVFLAFLISKPYKTDFKKNYFKLIISIILIAYALIIKQQAIFLILGILLYSLFNKNYFFKFFSLITLLVAAFTYYIFYQNENLWFFTVSAHTDDSFFTINELVRAHYKEIILIAQFIIFILFSSFHNLCEINFRSKLDYLISNLKSNIWFYLIFSFSITGIISSIKNGGNTGNSGLALILLFPFIYIFIYNFKKSVLIFVACAVLIFEIPNVIHSVNMYVSAKKFQSHVKKIGDDKNKLILTDQSTYFGSRLMRKNNSLTSLNTMITLNGHLLILKESYNIDIFNNEVSKKNYDYIISLNFSEKQINKKYYIKLFRNRMGYIYKKL